MCFVLHVYFIYTESHIIRFLIRLAKFLNLKKEGSSFAGRVVEPALRLLNENGLVAVRLLISFLWLIVCVQPLNGNICNYMYFCRTKQSIC